jgi:membrane protein YdbS with pleckstrin-like domain
MTGNSRVDIVSVLYLHSATDRNCESRREPNRFPQTFNEGNPAVSDSSNSNQTRIDQPESAADRFQREVAARQSGTSDHEVEECVWNGGYSPKAMIGTWLLIGFVSVVVLIAAFASPLTIPLAILSMLVIWGIGGLMYLYRRLNVRYELTNQRFIHQTGVLTRTTDRIEVIDIDDVSFTQGPVERIFGVGTIQLTGSDRTHPTLSMIGIAEVADVAGLLDDIRRAERRRRSLHIESI